MTYCKGDASPADHLPKSWPALMEAFREWFASSYYTTAPDKLPACAPLPKTWKADFRWWLDDQAERAWREDRT